MFGLGWITLSLQCKFLQIYEYSCYTSQHVNFTLPFFVPSWNSAQAFYSQYLKNSGFSSLIYSFETRIHIQSLIFFNLQARCTCITQEIPIVSFIYFPFELTFENSRFGFKVPSFSTLQIKKFKIVKVLVCLPKDLKRSFLFSHINPFKELHTCFLLVCFIVTFF